MKVMTILGTRPEIIRLSRLMPLLDSCCDHVVVHTGQNYDTKLSSIFFEELGLRQPDYLLECTSGSPMVQIGDILKGAEGVLSTVKPDRVLILGDTNSSLSAIVAKRYGYPVYHMEAGNRCYDDRVPEEVNRRIVDHASDVLLPYTERSRDNLVREGIARERIYVTGNPIREVLEHYAKDVAESQILTRHGLSVGGYVLVTLHRAENVDVPERLQGLCAALGRVRTMLGLEVVWSVHPRTRSHLERLNLSLDNTGIRALEPQGFFDFIRLEKNARCVLTDSGTVQEECCIFGVPNMTLRDTTERPETVEAGSNMICGVSPGGILRCLKAVLALPANWGMIPEYERRNVSGTVARIVLAERPKSG